jgi:diguanylate cyclase (GGDEF)-like protein
MTSRPPSTRGPERVGGAHVAAHILARRLTRTTDPARMHATIARAAAACARAEFAALALFDAAEGALRITATSGYPESVVAHVRVQPGEGLLGHVFATGRPLLVGAGSPLVLPHRRRYRTTSFIIMPLTGQAGTLGVLAVSDPREREQFDRADMRALRVLIQPAILALDRQRLREEVADVSRAAIVDPVTGLANRQYLQRRLSAEIQRALRAREPLALMLVDVDNFKAVNDTWGHLEGDRVLRDIAVVLSDHVRMFDVCTRYGGEEFAILMPGAEEPVAIQVAERVRSAVEQAYGQGQSGVHITISAGVALLVHDDTIESVLGRADEALLVAKRDGKNKVRVAEYERKAEG